MRPPRAARGDRCRAADARAGSPTAGRGSRWASHRGAGGGAGGDRRRRAGRWGCWSRCWSGCSAAWARLPRAPAGPRARGAAAAVGGRRRARCATAGVAPRSTRLNAATVPQWPDINPPGRCVAVAGRVLTGRPAVLAALARDAFFVLLLLAAGPAAARGAWRSPQACSCSLASRARSGRGRRRDVMRAVWPRDRAAYVLPHARTPVPHRTVPGIRRDGRRAAGGPARSPLPRRRPRHRPAAARTVRVAVPVLRRGWRRATSSAPRYRHKCENRRLTPISADRRRPPEPASLHVTQYGDHGCRRGDRVTLARDAHGITCRCSGMWLTSSLCASSASWIIF